MKLGPYLVLFVLGASLLSQGCKCGSSSGAADGGPKLLEPLSAPSWLVELPLQGFGAAAAAVPLGARTPRPIVVVLHGGADRPEWQCGTWTGITHGRAFVLCPRGVAKGERFGWGSPDATQKELRQALKALKARFGEHVDKGSVVLAAFGAGTKQATEIARQEPAFFSNLALVGVEDGAWSAGTAGVFVKRGGKSVLFVCSDPQCITSAERFAMFTRGAGAYSKLVSAGKFGRQLDGRVASAVEKEFPWLVDKDTRWGLFEKEK